MGFSLKRVNYYHIIPGIKIIGSTTVIPTEIGENHTRKTVSKK